MKENSEEVTAQSLMARLASEARRSGDARRIGTLARLVEACDEILSGEAYKRAKTAKLDPELFNPNFVRLKSNIVHQYVLLRKKLEGGNSQWNGPVATTIRAEKELMAYLALREREAERPKRPRYKGPRTRRLDEIVDRIEGISDQAVVRQALADGRAWKRELDILLAALRQLLPHIDIDALREGKALFTNPREPAVVAGLAPQDEHVLRKLVARVQDAEFLSEFGLVNRNGRLKMDIAPGLDLIFPEELQLLVRLSGAEPAQPALIT
jgi:hypothetical protein